MADELTKISDLDFVSSITDPDASYLWGIIPDNTSATGKKSVRFAISLLEGTPGSQITISSIAPVDADGINGDIHINKTTWDVYQKANGTWGTSLGTIKGTTGDPGVDGTVIGPRSTITITNNSVAANTIVTNDVTLAKSCLITAINVSGPCRVRCYTTSAKRTSDLSRLVTVPPTVGTQHGVNFDIVMTSANTTSFPATWVLSPTAIATNEDDSNSNTLYFSITNLDTITDNITVIITFLKIEY